MKRLLKRSGVATAGFVIILFLLAVAVLGPVFVKTDPYEMASMPLMSPGESNLLGTDMLGRDVAARLIYGARTSLKLGIISVGLAVAVGLPLGLAAGYFGGAVDNAIMRLMDIIFAFPPLLLAIVIAAVLGPGMTNAMLAIGIVYIPRMARIVRGPVLTVRTMEFVNAAEALGSTNFRTIFRHVLPNVLAPVMVQVTLNLSTAILAEAALSFLGLGAQPPEPSWGSMLNEGRLILELAPWLSIFPGAAIMLAVLGFNLLGDGLLDALDPRLKEEVS